MSLEERIAEAVDPTVFVRLCNAVLQSEHDHAFQVIDGTRGDDGNDGWLESQRRMFAIYCPVKPNGTYFSHYWLLVTVKFDDAAGLGARSFEPRVRFGSSFSHARLEAAGSMSNL